MSAIFDRLSVIIPFTEADPLWKDLLQDLITLGENSEIILVGPDSPDAEMFERATSKLIAKVRYVFAPKGVAAQLNAGSRAAQGDYLWFVHADTKVPRPALFALEKSLSEAPDALHYFRLQFLADGPSIMALNSVGANFRSRILQLPLGHQGYALSRATFYKIGGFNERCLQNEDRVFIWAAKRNRVPIKEVPAAIFTSARRYAAQGWGLTTGRELIYTAIHSTSQGLKLVKERLLEHSRI